MSASIIDIAAVSVTLRTRLLQSSDLPYFLKRRPRVKEGMKIDGTLNPDLLSMLATGKLLAEILCIAKKDGRG
jgi:hypothetical protein